MANARQHGGGPPSSPRALVGLGVEMAVAIVVFIFVGRRLDLWLGTPPWCLLAGALVGVTVAFYGFFRRVGSWGRGPDQGEP